MRRRVDVSSLNPSCRAPAMPQTTTGSHLRRRRHRDAMQHGREAKLAAAIMPSWLRRSSRTPPPRSTSQSRKLLVPQSTAAYAAWLIQVRPMVGISSGRYYILLSDRPFVPLQSVPRPSTSPSGQEKVSRVMP